VRDWRVAQLHKLPDVAVYRESRLDAAAVRETGCSLVALATGARWRADGVGRVHAFPLAGLDRMPVLTPDDIMDGVLPAGPVVIFDDDHYYMGGIIAEKLARAGLAVMLVTPESLVSAFTQFTLEQVRIQRRLIELGVAIMTAKSLVALHAGEAELACIYTDRRERVAAATAVLVTMQSPDDALYHALMAAPAELRLAGIRKVVRIGDCLAPGTIAAAVYAGHRFARALDVAAADAVDFRRENVALSALD
jgi:dimethylamine/trimethylamine dehydrogenase